MSNSKYLEITVATTSLGSELVANLFFEIGCDAVSIIDKNDLQDLYNRKETWDYVDENLFNMDETVYVKSGILKSEYDVVYQNLKDKLDNLKKLSSFDLGSLEIDAKDIEEEDWRYVWRKFYKPIKVGKFVVIPKWIDYSLSSGEYPIYIEPGMAFGTGEHETTKNALRLLSTIDLSEKVVADVGTGSGILGIGAIRLGTKYCYMYDIDSQCIETATENAKLNDVQNCEIVCADLFEKGIDKVDVVVANITADVLVRLAEKINQIVKKDGKVLLSGILDISLENVIKTYENAGFKVINQINDKEWYALTLEPKN